MIRRPPRSTLFPYTDALPISLRANPDGVVSKYLVERAEPGTMVHLSQAEGDFVLPDRVPERILFISGGSGITDRKEHTSELQSRQYLVCRLLLEKKKISSTLF